jgi:hypothetical protein
VELCQRTDQLSIVSVMGRGTPVPLKLLRRSGCVKVWYGAVGKEADDCGFRISDCGLGERRKAQGEGRKAIWDCGLRIGEFFADS